MADEGGCAGTGTGLSDVHSDIIQTHILTRLDGPSLASAGGASSPLHHLCAEQSLWKNICNASWPSTADTSLQEIISGFPSGHRSFYADSYPAILLNSEKQDQFVTGSVGTSELISAVDIRYGDQLLYSKVSVTETSSAWFACSPFRTDLFGKETVPTLVKFDGEDGKCMDSLEENMLLSWIMTDPEKKRAVNLSSTRPVEVRRHWLTGDIQVRYATVMAAASGGDLVYCKMMVTCGVTGGGEMLVREVSMQVEDMEGKTVVGKDSLVILHRAMEGKRRKGRVGEEKRIYEMFLEIRREWRERKHRREKRKDMACVVIGATIFLAFWIFVLFR